MDFCDNSLLHTLLRRLHDENGYAELNGIELLSFTAEGGVGTMPITREKLNPNGTVHGGALYTLADTVAGTTAVACGMVRTGQGAERLSCTTVDGTLHFLRPSRGKSLTCRAAPRKIGGTLAVIDISILDDQAEETCSGTFTFFYVDKQRYMKTD